MLFLTAILISLFASTIGCICGIGGGVIIKPTLDFFHVMEVSTISFLSGCTVLAMTTYSVLMQFLDRRKRTDCCLGSQIKWTLPLAIGAAAGGLVGKLIFDSLKNAFDNQQTVGAVQSLVLALVTALTLVYTLKKSKIQTHTVTHAVCSIGIGFALGSISAFLGIGGGPINLMVLSFFYSMDTKTAARSSLFIIMFSQITSLITTLVTRTVPQFDPLLFVAMIVCGIVGSVIGRQINKRILAKHVDRLFIGFTAVIVCISLYNIVQYL